MANNLARPEDLSESAAADWNTFERISNGVRDFRYRGFTQSELDAERESRKDALSGVVRPSLEEVVVEAMQAGVFFGAMQAASGASYSDLEQRSASDLFDDVRGQVELVRYEDTKTWQEIEEIGAAERDLREFAEYELRFSEANWVKNLIDQHNRGGVRLSNWTPQVSVFEFLKFRLTFGIDDPDNALGPIPDTDEGRRIYSIISDALYSGGYAEALRAVADPHTYNFNHRLLRLDEEAVAYYERLESQHINGANTLGSHYEGFVRLVDFLNFAEEVRGHTGGDDRDRITELLEQQGASPETIAQTFRADVRYLLIEADRLIGRVGIIATNGLPDKTPILLKRGKPGTPHSVGIRASDDGLPTTNLATLIIGEDADGSMLITTFAGLPTPPFQDLFPTVEEPIATTLGELRSNEKFAANAQYAMAISPKTFDQEYPVALNANAIRNMDGRGTGVADGGM